MELYKKHIDEDGIFHLGSVPYSVIVDIDDKGNLDLKTDKELVEAYGNGDDDDNNDDGDKAKNIYIGSQTSRIDNKPMG
jgi:competence protein ComEC